MRTTRTDCKGYNCDFDFMLRTTKIFSSLVQSTLLAEEVKHIHLWIDLPSSEHQDSTLPSDGTPCRIQQVPRLKPASDAGRAVKSIEEAPTSRQHYAAGARARHCQHLDSSAALWWWVLAPAA